MGFNKYRRIELYNKQKGYCYYCQDKIKFEHFTVDHVVPKWQKGQDNMRNLVGSCQLCNRMKGGKTLDLYNYLLHKNFDSHTSRLLSYSK